MTEVKIAGEATSTDAIFRSGHDVEWLRTPVLWNYFASILKILLLNHKKYFSIILIAIYIWMLSKDELSVTGKLNFSTPLVCRWGSQLPEWLKSHCGSKYFVLVKVSFLRNIHKFNVKKGSQVIRDWHLHTHRVICNILSQCLWLCMQLTALQLSSGITLHFKRPAQAWI